MIIEKNNKVYNVKECSDKWKISLKNGKLSVDYDISKEICSTADDLREYVLSNDNIF